MVSNCTSSQSQPFFSPGEEKTDGIGDKELRTDPDRKIEFFDGPYFHRRDLRIIDANQIPSKLTRQWKLAIRQQDEQCGDIDEFDSPHNLFRPCISLPQVTPIVSEKSTLFIRDDQNCDPQRVIIIERQDANENLNSETKPQPNTDCSNHFEIPIGIASNQGKRPSMEDRYVVHAGEVNIQNSSHAYAIFAVLDGHGGSEAVEELQKKLVPFLENKLGLMKTCSDAELFNALKLFCVHLDIQIKSSTSSGSTGIFGLRINGDLWVINVGDSRAIWIQENGQTIQLSEDAKPDDPRYAKSIKKRGGEITKASSDVARINNGVAVARAFGDASMVSRNTVDCSSTQKQKIFYCASARPKIVKIKREEIEKKKGFLVLCSDGLTDVASTNRIGRWVHFLCSMERQGNNSENQNSKIQPTQSKTNSPDDSRRPADSSLPEFIADKLVQAAIKLGSEDNITVMVAPLCSAC